MIWFTADYHLSHRNIMKYSNRPFNDVNEMDETIFSNLESKVKKRDILYFLGDLTFNIRKAHEFFERFENVEIHFIVGNHDNKKTIKIARERCTSVSHLKEISLTEKGPRTPESTETHAITLCHYAMRVWNKSHFNSWQLYAHSHGKLNPLGKQYDVGVDNNNFMPVSFNQLIKIMENQQNNFNFIPLEHRTKYLEENLNIKMKKEF